MIGAKIIDGNVHVDFTKVEDEQMQKAFDRLFEALTSVKFGEDIYAKN